MQVNYVTLLCIKELNVKLSLYVVVVNRQIPLDGLSWGRMCVRGFGEGFDYTGVEFGWNTGILLMNLALARG
jgi:hypothetical protein